MSLLVRLGIALILTLFGLISYCTSTVDNPITGEKQRIQLSPQEEIQLGLQARSEMAAQYGGLYPDNALQEYVERVGEQVVQQSKAKSAPYRYEFHLLRDPQTVNAFALPGGQVFITTGLLRRLSSEAQLAAVLGHEVGHVVARHASEHLAKQQLGAALVNAVGIAASNGEDAGRQAAVIAQAVNQVVSLRYGRNDELESDRLGFQFMTEAGYNPKALVELMRVLGSARSGSQSPEFFSTHPNPDNRVQRLQTLIAETYPNGIPANLESGQQEFRRYVLPRLSGTR